jgi:hypothetical protein
MTCFTATFENGTTLTRNSDRHYAFAWAIFETDGRVYKSGFSADCANAQKAVEANMPRFLSVRDRKHPAIRRHLAKLAKEQGFACIDALHAHWDAETAARRAALRIEITTAN